MRLQIQKWGNGAAIRLGKSLLQQVSGEIGSTVDVEIKNGGIFLKPVKNNFTLENILETCTKDNMRLTDDDKQWLNDQQGREI